MKRCARCKETKPYSDFNKETKAKDGLQYHCRSCKAALHQENRDRRLESIRRTRAVRLVESRGYVVQWLRDHPCIDCGNPDLRVLEFDHVAGEKVAGVAALVREGYSLNAIKEEIAKCEVRCRNCHIIKTFERMGGTWHDKYMPCQRDADGNLLNF